MDYDYREEFVTDESLEEEERVKASLQEQGWTFITKVYPADRPGQAVLQFRKGEKPQL